MAGITDVASHRSCYSDELASTLESEVVVVVVLAEQSVVAEAAAAGFVDY